MTAGGTRAVPAVAAGPGTPQPARSPRAAMRLVRLYAASRRVPAAVTAIAACALGLRIALTGHWDSYGALQLPLVFEAAAATAIAVTAASPLGEPERVTGRWLPYLRLAVTLALTAAAIGALAAAGTGTHLAGGTLDVAAQPGRDHRHRPAVRRHDQRRAGLDRAGCLPATRRICPVHPVAPPGADHALAVARPATA